MKSLEPEFSHEDSRRKLTQLLTADIKQVNVYECQANVNLGNHFHKKTVEFFYILDGEIESNGETKKEGDLFVYYPETMHTIWAKTTCRFMTFLTVPFDKENPDLWKS